jgi:hypothetical protein
VRQHNDWRNLNREEKSSRRDLMKVAQHFSAGSGVWPFFQRPRERLRARFFLQAAALSTRSKAVA